MRSPFCCSASLALLAQEQSLCCDDLGAAVNSDIAAFFFFFFIYLESQGKAMCIMRDEQFFTLRNHGHK